MLRYQSERDALTNCDNRRTFSEALERLGDAADATCAFLLIDIDQFKSINDEHGHLVGDRVITQVAAELGRHLDAGTPLYRYGGEEFAVILAHVDAAAASALAERLRAGVAGADFQGIATTASIGLAPWQARRGSIPAAIGQTDRRLYDAKRAGRNRVMAPGGDAAR
jgi:diguanylate cyclase (GGDEF)-like protein